MYLEEALELASRIRPLLEPFCDRITIAGSVRRESRMVKDLELVIISRPGTGSSGPQQSLFDLAPAATPIGDDAVTAFLRAECEYEASLWTKRLSKNGRTAFGRENKLLRFDGYPVDVFTTSPARWGMTMFVRTGDKDWNRIAFGQLKRRGMHASPYGGVITNTKSEPPFEQICRIEQDVFDALGIEYVEPEMRNELNARKLIGAPNWY